MTVNQLLGPHLSEGIRGQAQQDSQSVDEMLALAEANLGRPNAQIVEPEAPLGAGQYLIDRLTGVPKDEALRRALKDWLADDKTFDHTDRDDTFKDVTAAVGPSIDFIVTGHTHLERAIDMGGGRFYFNCGTWIRLLRFTDAMLKDQNSFKPVYDVLIDGRMELIDEAKFGGERFVMNQTSAVSIKVENGAVVGRLSHIIDDGTGAPQVIQQFVRK